MIEHIYGILWYFDVLFWYSELFMVLGWMWRPTLSLGFFRCMGQDFWKACTKCRKKRGQSAKISKRLRTMHICWSMTEHEVSNAKFFTKEILFFTKIGMQKKKHAPKHVVFPTGGWPYPLVNWVDCCLLKIGLYKHDSPGLMASFACGTSVCTALGLLTLHETNNQFSLRFNNFPQKKHNTNSISCRLSTWQPISQICHDAAGNMPQQWCFRSWRANWRRNLPYKQSKQDSS